MIQQPSIDDRAEELGALDDELVIRPRRSAMPDAEMDITPMIDITFLLLIFFLVSASLSKQAPVELPAAQYGDAVAADEAAIVTIDAAGVTGHAVIYKGDGINGDMRLAQVDLQAQEDALAEYLQAELDAHPRKRHVLIKAARHVKHRHVVRVSHAAGRVLTDRQLFIAVMEKD